MENIKNKAMFKKIKIKELENKIEDYKIETKYLKRTARANKEKACQKENELKLVRSLFDAYKENSAIKIDKLNKIIQEQIKIIEHLKFKLNE